MSGKKFVAFFEDKFGFLRLPESGLKTLGLSLGEYDYGR